MSIATSTCKVVNCILFTGTGSNLVLRQVTVPIIDQSTCASRDYSGRYMDTTTMICAGYEHGGKDSCQVQDYMSKRILHSLSAHMLNNAINQFQIKWIFCN